MLVPLTSTQSARPPRLCGRQNQSSAATSASWATRKAAAFACGSRGRRLARGGTVTTLLLIVEAQGGSVRSRPVLLRADRDDRGAARGPELPAPERSRLDRAVHVAGDGHRLVSRRRGREGAGRGRADREAAHAVPVEGG